VRALCSSSVRLAPRRASAQGSQRLTRHAQPEHSGDFERLGRRSIFTFGTL
jgi:hypothetical protein